MIRTPHPAADAVRGGAAFASGRLVARGLRASGPDGRSLVFGLGMSNNGTGLVLAASSLGGLPATVVPVLAYNLAQHLAAGGVARLLASRERLRSRVGLPAEEPAACR